MSLYNESIELIDYQLMVDDIAKARQDLEMAKRIDQLGDRRDLAIDHNGEVWIVAPVSANAYLPLPIFYRFKSIKSRIVGRETRPMVARSTSHSFDQEPKSAKSIR